MTATRPCNLPDTSENRARIDMAFRKWWLRHFVSRVSGSQIIRIKANDWRIVVISFLLGTGDGAREFPDGETGYYVLFSDDVETEHLTFEEVER